MTKKEDKLTLLLIIAEALFAHVDDGGDNDEDAHNTGADCDKVHLHLLTHYEIQSKKVTWQPEKKQEMKITDAKQSRTRRDKGNCM